MKNNKKIIQNRIIKTVELPTFGDFEMNPLYYYGTKYNPLLFDGMFTATDFLDLLVKHFNWVDYVFDENLTIKEKDIMRIKVILTDLDLTEVTFLYLDYSHTCDLPIIPEFLNDIKPVDY